MEGNRFCTACGAELPDEATFCPECGANVNGTANPYVHQNHASRSNGPGILPTFILIYGILATIGGLMDAVTYAGLTEGAYNELIDMISEMIGMDISSQMPVWTPSMPILMTLSSIAMLISGVLAILCYMKCKDGENWKVSVILCLASSIACIGICSYPLFASLGIPTLTIGILVTVLLYMKKDSFSS